jgi:hypothetical protein
MPRPKLTTEACVALVRLHFEAKVGERVRRDQLAEKDGKWRVTHPILVGHTWYTVVKSFKKVFGKEVWHVDKGCFLGVKRIGAEDGHGHASFGGNRPTILTHFQKKGGTRQGWASMSKGEQENFRNEIVEVNKN